MNHTKSPETRVVGLSSKAHVLFVNAHPDDEAMAHSALISNLTDTDPKRVTVLTATLGQASTVGADVAESGGRLQEAEAAYDFLGVQPENRVYLDLADAQLHKRQNVLRLAWQIGRVSVEKGVSDIVTPGEQGFDGHSDHSAMHTATLLAAGMLRLRCRHVTVWGLSASGGSDMTVPVEYAHKHKALEFHKSQNSQRLDNILQHEPYSSLMQEENYVRSDSWSSYGRALFRLITGRHQHIPKLGYTSDQIQNGAAR